MAYSTRPAQQTGERPLNPVGEAYRFISFFQICVWIGSIIVFSLAAVTVDRTTCGTPLYVAAAYNLGVGLVFVFYFCFSAPLAKPASQSTARPPMLYILLHFVWLCLWGAAGPLMLIYRYDNDYERSRYTKRRIIHIGSTIVAARPSNTATPCAAFGIICFIFYLCSTYSILKLLLHQFDERDVRIFREEEARKDADRNRNVNATTTAG
ncbi:hypothetical protein BJX66DRAFT_345608 [Aspergillus keveii]|uniref:MARVEL domain-containing protein n=1 Tax=Aspergillus keveii TaxID=714993 RepID=A0ABR4FHH5_9EURO